MDGTDRLSNFVGYHRSTGHHSQEGCGDAVPDGPQADPIAQHTRASRLPPVRVSGKKICRLDMETRLKNQPKICLMDTRVSICKLIVVFHITKEMQLHTYQRPSCLEQLPYGMVCRVGFADPPPPPPAKN